MQRQKSTVELFQSTVRNAQGPRVRSESCSEMFNGLGGRLTVASELARLQQAHRVVAGHQQAGRAGVALRGTLCDLLT